MNKLFLLIFLGLFFSNLSFAADVNIAYRCDETFYIESTCYPTDAIIDENGNCTCPSGGCQKCPRIIGSDDKDYYCYYPINIMSILSNEKNFFSFDAKVTLHYEDFGHDNSCGKYDIRPVNCESIALVTATTTVAGAGAATAIAGPIGSIGALLGGAIVTVVECTQDDAHGYITEKVIKDIRFDYKMPQNKLIDGSNVYDKFINIYASKPAYIGPSDYYAILPRLEHVKNDELGVVDKIIRFYISQRDKLDAVHFVMNVSSTSSHNEYFDIYDPSFANINVTQSVFYQQLLASGSDIIPIDTPFNHPWWKSIEYCGFNDKIDFENQGGSDSVSWSQWSSAIFTDNPSELPELSDKSFDDLKSLFNMGDSHYLYHKDVGVKCYNNPYISSLFVKKYEDIESKAPIKYQNTEFPIANNGIRLPPPISEPFFPEKFTINSGNIYSLPKEPYISWDIISGTENSFLNPGVIIKIDEGKDDGFTQDIKLNKIINIPYKNYYNLQFYAQIENNQNVNLSPELCLYMCYAYIDEGKHYCSIDSLSDVRKGKHDLESYLMTPNKILRDNAKNKFLKELAASEKCYKVIDFDILQANSSIMLSGLGINSTYDNPKMAVRLVEKGNNSSASVFDLYSKSEVENSLQGVDMIYKESLKNKDGGIVLRPELMTIKHEMNITKGNKYCQYYYPQSTMTTKNPLNVITDSQAEIKTKKYSDNCILHNDTSILKDEYYNHICLHNLMNKKYDSVSELSQISYYTQLNNHPDVSQLAFPPNDEKYNVNLKEYPLKQIPFLLNYENKIFNHYKDDYKNRIHYGDYYSKYFTYDKPLGDDSDELGHNLCISPPSKILSLSYDLIKENYEYNSGSFNDFSAINPIYNIKITYRDPKKIDASNEFIDGNLNSNVNLFGYNFSVDAKILKDRHNFWDGSLDSVNNNIFSLISPTLQAENTIDANHSSPSKPKNKTTGIDTESVIVYKKFDYYHDLKIEMENTVNYAANNQQLCLYYSLKDYEKCNCFNNNELYLDIKSCYESCDEWGEKTPFSNGCHIFKNCLATTSNSIVDGVANFSIMPETLPYTEEVSGSCPIGGETIVIPKSRCDQYGNWHYLEGHCVPGCSAYYSTQKLRYASDGSYHFHGINGDDDHNNQRFHFVAATADFTEEGNQDSNVNQIHEATTYCDFKYTGTITAQDTCLASNSGWLNNVTRVTDNCQRIQCPATELSLSIGGKTYKYNMPSNINSETEATYNCSNFAATGGIPLSGTYKVKCQNIGNTSKSRGSTQSDFEIRTVTNGCARKCFGKAQITIPQYDSLPQTTHLSVDNVENFVTAGGMHSGQIANASCDNFDGVGPYSSSSKVIISCNDGNLSANPIYCYRTCNASNYDYRASDWVKSIRINGPPILLPYEGHKEYCKDRNDLNDESPVLSSDEQYHINFYCDNGIIRAENGGFWDGDIYNEGCKLFKLEGDSTSRLRSGIGHCLDWSGGYNNAPIKAYECATRNNRQFYRHGTNQIKDAESNLCMDLGTNDPDGDVNAYHCHSTSDGHYDHQKWYYDYKNRLGTYNSEGNYQCLTDMGDDQQVYVRDCTDNANQKWYQH